MVSGGSRYAQYLRLTTNGDFSSALVNVVGYEEIAIRLIGGTRLQRFLVNLCPFSVE